MDFAFDFMSLMVSSRIKKNAHYLYKREAEKDVPIGKI